MKHIKGLYSEIVARENIFLLITMMTIFSVVNFIEKHIGPEEPIIGIGLDSVFFFTITYIIIHSVSRYKDKLKIENPRSVIDDEIEEVEKKITMARAKLAKLEAKKNKQGEKL